MAEATLATDVPWYAGYPEARSSPATITRSDLLNMIEAGKKPGVDYILIDLRRTDHEGGTISGSINLPAQSLYPTIPTLYATFRAARIPKIIWYCGSSRGRGTRAAAWFADYLDDRHEDQVLMESIVLLEGIKGWATAGDEYNAKMQEYDAGIWKD
ncbi:hypothetical protein D6D17_10385 [Aureobasidium pullulans]|uniref:Rhodanese domain-containing protein n=1 Tax=Aureobasidium pullulans TaxID=5580 RepID=A0A4S9I3I8_AURPU|nr:hypothetical protein D6D23_05181 [Aureobasidium pullulans]THW76940.1 hypothetical protein D6D17_10385 [Aureobasidium pullulans]THX44711.1 hypothetical protein D6D10_00075 [Aureobasidium pullulans]THX83151.1 hypothetical protein D6D04_03123 [Aureobasidium pullulans]